VRLGYLGRLDPLKGIDVLLDTLIGKLGGRSWTLVLGGRGDAAYEAQLRSRHADPRITYLGFVPPSELLSRVDVLVVPSLFDEPLARVLIEACAHGVAVIGARRGGIPEVIEPGKTGLVFDPDDPEGLAQAIVSMLDDRDQAEAMKVAALAKWQRAFTPGKTLAEYREVYAAVSEATAIGRR
jgi:glycosyltransferase involved in cell wall biosynthesis